MEQDNNTIPRTRPFTLDEFARKIITLTKELPFTENLDYFSSSMADKNQKLINNAYTVISTTTFGHCEGIYTDFSLRGEKEQHLATAKTLLESEQAFLDMHLFAARVCLTANKYISQLPTNEFVGLR